MNPRYQKALQQLKMEIEKQASTAKVSGMKQALKTMLPSILMGVGFYTVPAALGGAADFVKGLYYEHKANNAFEEALKEIEKNIGEPLSPEQYKKARKAFEAIKAISPEIASNPVLLESYLSSLAHAELDVLPQYIHQIADIRKKLKDAQSTHVQESFIKQIPNYMPNYVPGSE